MSNHVITLLLAAGMSHVDAYSARHLKVTPIVAAIISHESHGKPNICKDEDDGSSSWGLMQLNHKGTHCDETGFRKYGILYDPVTNIREGIELLAIQKAWHLKHCKHPHDVLEHYAGSGKDAKKFAKEIRKLAKSYVSKNNLPTPTKK